MPAGKLSAVSKCSHQRHLTSCSELHVEPSTLMTVLYNCFAFVPASTLVALKMDPNRLFMRLHSNSVAILVVSTSRSTLAVALKTPCSRSLSV